MVVALAGGFHQVEAGVAAGGADSLWRVQDDGDDGAVRGVGGHQGSGDGLAGSEVDGVEAGVVTAEVGAQGQGRAAVPLDAETDRGT